ncbi:MAG: hypothetical protein KDJ78_15480 [Rhodobacteraceae bacterium]|uniref:hypothetical protein n=1 Tax=Amaricoccus sp. TaxID=1872485 RepID=UPI001E022B0C|nr:hypothetical protein [Amaricoccus sp.]MCB1375550.1 hypothetical protein [Paracoccaceae bacterium]MCB1404341.1 hypothetical protein [Paracoccaceae bacterium]HRW15265.1 hypothetical protein [Amaricoccus sp.]
MRVQSLISPAAVALALALTSAALAQVQLDHGTAETLTALGIDTSLVTDQDDVGYINQILASDADDATKKAEIMKLLEEK